MDGFIPLSAACGIYLVDEFWVITVKLVRVDSHDWTWQGWAFQQSFKCESL